ncbi:MULTISPECIES: ABC transporter ATP-binding protein [unclassified Achromobacter]|uniref:ABC transporter ATP-binding protein n=1 Tax=unclassified Achromobacter TaxID=2626865 RepID=UPI000B5152BE|nr:MULTISPECIES: ABC transporter ATP-binding protein [unclassified Achromobacter]OWT80317.1 Fe3+/spermidine/putrescine ABC transporter ATP-binding protein [Achromobacter sp. HZ34]OWT82200.1 Fe3+/spermidine/putrescine ABC transporter ATP-binding protein [Achromobacter sp. HZ28]
MEKRTGHALRLEHIGHRFQNFEALRDVDLEIRAGELVALLGPSGCGKSTLLRILSGFLRQTSGRVLFDGVPVDHLAADKRGVGIVFQNYALFPHMTVRQNIAYGLEAQGWPRARIGGRVDEMLDMVHMQAHGTRLPRQLSGGQQQRIALARCLAVDPKILLLDEPFGALDKNLRLDMQMEVKRLQREYGITTILVTHDQEEALSMADRIAVMNLGAIEQIATPAAIYDQPATAFVNAFVGATNLLDGRIVEGGPQRCVVELADGVAWRLTPGRAIASGTAVRVSVRPEHWRIDAESGDGSEKAHAQAHGDGDPAGLMGHIDAVLTLGPQFVYGVRLDGGASIKVAQSRPLAQRESLAAGARVRVTPVLPDACQVFPVQGQPA